MQDSVWPSACCAPTIKGEATTCVRQSAMKWMCELETMVNTKAYAATVRKASPLALCALGVSWCMHIAQLLISSNVCQHLYLEAVAKALMDTHGIECTSCVSKKSNFITFLLRYSSCLAVGLSCGAHVQGAFGSSLGSVTALAKLRGTRARSYRVALASSMAAAQAHAANSDLSMASFQTFASVVPHGERGVVLQREHNCPCYQILRTFLVA